jgi:two-component system, LytTR family, sensor kinase
MLVDWSKLGSPKQRSAEAAFANPSPIMSDWFVRFLNGDERWGVRLWMLCFVCWSLVAIVDVAGSKAYAVAAGYHPPSLRLLLTWSFTYAYGMALLTPAICALSKRCPFTRLNWGKAALVQLPGSVLIAGAGALLTASANLLLPWSRPFLESGFSAQATSLFLGNLPRCFLIVAISQAVFYYYRFRERELQSLQLEGQLAHARLSALKMQLQPHFIFNVLNAIATLTRRNPAASESMTLQLAELLRLSLQAAEVHQVPFRQELRFLECYLRIQQTRFVDRLSVELKVDDEVMDAGVPPLLLQPLVENAIQHGISPRMAPGKVTVRAQRRCERLEIQIHDDGVGFDATTQLREGLGLRNTRARLQQLHGSDFEFACVNIPEGGCQVTVSIPFIALESRKGAAYADTVAYRG